MKQKNKILLAIAETIIDVIQQKCVNGILTGMIPSGDNIILEYHAYSSKLHLIFIKLENSVTIRIPFRSDPNNRLKEVHAAILMERLSAVEKLFSDEISWESILISLQTQLIKYI